MCRSDAASIAPVFPAETTTSASPSATARTARTSDESVFDRTASTAWSSIEIDSDASTSGSPRVSRPGGPNSDRLDLGRGRGSGARNDLLGRAISPESVDGDADHGVGLYGASMRSGSTSRPLYVLQFGQTRCGRFGCLQFGQTCRRGTEIPCCARRLSRLDLDVFRFGNGHERLRSIATSRSASGGDELPGRRDPLEEAPVVRDDDERPVEIRRARARAARPPRGRGGSSARRGRARSRRAPAAPRGARASARPARATSTARPMCSGPSPNFASSVRAPTVTSPVRATSSSTSGASPSKTPHDPVRSLRPRCAGRRFASRRSAPPRRGACRAASTSRRRSARRSRAALRGRGRRRPGRGGSRRARPTAPSRLSTWSERRAPARERQPQLPRLERLLRKLVPLEETLRLPHLRLERVRRAPILSARLVPERSALGARLRAPRASAAP